MNVQVCSYIFTNVPNMRYVAVASYMLLLHFVNLPNMHKADFAFYQFTQYA